MNTRWTAAVRRYARDRGLELPPDIAEEFAAHLEDAYVHAIRQGATERAAYERALGTLAEADFSAFTMRRRADPQRQSRLQGIELDFRYAIRLLARSPLFSLTVAGLLAFSVAITCTAFTVLDAVLLRPLPYPNAHALAALVHLDKNGKAGAMSAADWSDLATRVARFEGVAAYSSWTHNLTGDGEPLRLRSVITSGNYFAVLGTDAQTGRTFDDRHLPNLPLTMRLHRRIGRTFFSAPLLSSLIREPAFSSRKEVPDAAFVSRCCGCLDGDHGLAGTRSTESVFGCARSRP